MRISIPELILVIFEISSLTLPTATIEPVKNNYYDKKAKKKVAYIYFIS
tara:strand:+ start:4976 stop:5122 length:147 start_codon:yes stop_codon:yes gene_type:complete